MRTLWLRTLAILAAVGVLLGAQDVALRLVSPYRSFVKRDVVDIQAPSILRAKLEALRAHDGIGVALLGDSVPYGRTMAAYGDRDWREHTLDRALEAELRARLPDGDVYVANLGMNGAVPADVAAVARAALDAGADLIVADVTLRSFSADFEQAEAEYSRPWLADFARGGAPDWIERAWLTYDLREFLQWRVLGGTPRGVADAALGTANSRLLGRSTAEDPLLLALAARQRYETIGLAPDHPQLRAMNAMLADAAARETPVLLFYSTENPLLIDQIIEPARRQALLAELEAVIAAAPGDVAYVPPLASLEAERFLDQVHLDAEGYRRLASVLAEAAAGELRTAQFGTSAISLLR